MLDSRSRSSSSPLRHRGGTIVTGLLQSRRATSAPSIRRGRGRCTRTSSARCWRSLAHRGLREPRWVGWSRGLARLVLAAVRRCSLMTQSRQALIGLIGRAIVIVVLRRGSDRSVALRPALLIPAAWLGRHDGDRAGRVAEPVQFGLPATRVVPRGVRILEARPSSDTACATGTRPGEPPFQPPQAEIEVLASAGVVGLDRASSSCGSASLVVLWRVDPRSEPSRSRSCSPAGSGPVRPVLGRRPGVGSVRDRGNLPGGDGS